MEFDNVKNHVKNRVDLASSEYTVYVTKSNKVRPVLDKAKSGYYEKLIKEYYTITNKRIEDDEIKESTKSKALDAVKDIREAMSDKIFDDCREARFNKPAQVQLARDTTSFYDFPNKFKAWQDLDYYRNRLIVLGW